MPESVWDFSRVCGTFGERCPEFPTQLPLDLVRRALAVSTRPGDVVADPFSGSGTSCVAALSLGRRFAGCDLNPDTAWLARGRARAYEADQAQQQKETA